MLNAASELNWYAMQTRSNFEKRVADELSGAGLEAYLPVFRELHQWKDRRKVVEVPLFRGYVFVHMADCEQARTSAVRANGAVRILGHNGRIEAIPQIEMDSVRRLMTANAPFALHPFLTEGAWVQVRRGPLKGIQGRLLRVKTEHRLILSIDLLSQSVATEVDVSDVRAVRPETSGHVLVA